MVMVMWMAANWHADYIHRMNRENSCNDFGHDNSTVIMRHVMDTSLPEARTLKAAVTCEHDHDNDHDHPYACMCAFLMCATDMRVLLVKALSIG